MVIRPRMRPQRSKLGSYQQPLGYIFEGGRSPTASRPRGLRRVPHALQPRTPTTGTRRRALETCPISDTPPHANGGLLRRTSFSMLDMVEFQRLPPITSAKSFADPKHLRSLPT